MYRKELLLCVVNLKLEFVQDKITRGTTVRTRISWVPFSSSKEPFEKMTLGESYGLKNYTL